jgi:hypothetical protein
MRRELWKEILRVAIIDLAAHHLLHELGVASPNDAVVAMAACLLHILCKHKLAYFKHLGAIAAVGMAIADPKKIPIALLVGLFVVVLERWGRSASGQQFW